MRGDSLCKVEAVKFPACINYKLLFVIVTMLNTIHDALMPAENCTLQCWEAFTSLRWRWWSSPALLSSLHLRQPQRRMTSNRWWQRWSRWAEWLVSMWSTNINFLFKTRLNLSPTSGLRGFLYSSTHDVIVNSDISLFWFILKSEGTSLTIFRS